MPTGRMIPRAFVSSGGVVTYTKQEGSQTFEEIYTTSDGRDDRYLVVELPDGSFVVSDMWDAQHQNTMPRVKITMGDSYRRYDDLDQAIMATVLTIGNSTDRMSMVAPWTVKYGVTIIDERNKVHVEHPRKLHDLESARGPLAGLPPR